MNKIEIIFSEDSLLIDRKTFSILSGIIAQGLLVSSIFNFNEHNYIVFLIKLCYAFFYIITAIILSNESIQL